MRLRVSPTKTLSPRIWALHPPVPTDSPLGNATYPKNMLPPLTKATEMGSLSCYPKCA